MMRQLNEVEKIIIGATIAATTIFASIMAGSHYGNKVQCEETAELYGDTRWQYTSHLGCMIHHDGRWISGEALRNGTRLIEKEGQR